MRPTNLQSKIFLDGGDPDETKKVVRLLGFLDGQTTNPTLISKNPKTLKRLKKGKKFKKGEILNFYRKIVRELSSIIPQGSISIEVYSDFNTKAKEMLEQARIMSSWIPNGWIKFPITKEGLIAAEIAVKKKIKVNMTLCFTQEQAAAVYSASKGAIKGNVYVSPFVGRLDDKGDDGMSLINNIIKMYKGGDGHVDVLTASVRNLDHLLYAIYLGSDIITAPYKILKDWAESGVLIPSRKFKYNNHNLKKIPYKKTNLRRNWKDFNITNELTQDGLKRFSNDWNFLLE